MNKDGNESKGDKMSTFTEGSATARIVADSTYQGSRLVSVETTFPRPFLAEFNTHCRFSRNSASSRAIPVWKRLLAVLENPYIPNSFGVNKSGMQAGEELSSEDKESVVKNWLFGRDIALAQAYYLTGGRKEITANLKGDSLESAEKMCDDLEALVENYKIKDFLYPQDKGLHKQHANRVLEPYAFHTVIVTATHWRNFFGLRASAMAQPEAQDFAIAIAKAMMASKPKELSRGEWHLPYIREDDMAEALEPEEFARASAGKCARTSYLTQDGKRSLEEDIKLADRLHSSGHMSPFQHPARPHEDGDPAGSNGNYSSVWTQLRKLIENESDFSLLASREDLLAGCRGDEEMVEFVLSLAE